MTKKQIEVEIVALWQENAKLRDRVTLLESSNRELNREIESLKASRNDVKTTLREITTSKEESPIALSQQVIEEWYLNEQERKELERERLNKTN